MRRLFTIVSAMCLATALHAQELNIYASGLSADAVDNTKQEVKISYTLNAPATSLAIILQEGDKTPNEILITEVAALVKGAHKDVIVNLNTIPTGDYTWKIKATGTPTGNEPVAASTTTAGTFTTPRGLAINTNFDSPFFGNVYVTDSKNATTTGGIYVFDAAFSDITGQGETAWSQFNSTSPASPFRITIAPDDKLYITDWSDNATSGVHVWNPATPATNAVSVFGGTIDKEGLAKEGDVAIHGSVSHCYVTGTGADTKLYTYDEDLPKIFNSYAIGNLETLWVAAPTPIALPAIMANKNGMIFPDKKDGWWVSQHRATDPVAGTNPGLIHMNASGVADYISMGALKSNTLGSLALNADQSQIATAGTVDEKKPLQGQIHIFDVAWNNDGVPTLSLKYDINTTFTTASASACYSVVFDVAGNVAGGVPLPLHRRGNDRGNFIHRGNGLVNAANGSNGLLGFILDGGNLYRDFFGGAYGLVGKVFDLCRHHGKAFAGITGTGGFNGGI